MKWKFEFSAIWDAVPSKRSKEVDGLLLIFYLELHYEALKTRGLLG